jgi:1-acyl-sn-glycerol-3-phosphate acyltransferase
VAHNAGLFWPRNGFVKKPGVIDMVIGPVIDTKDKSAREVMQTAETWIEGQARRLLPIADA